MKKFTAQFSFELPDGSSNADARLFITEALMRLKRDAAIANPKNKQLGEIVLPKSNDIVILE